MSCTLITIKNIFLTQTSETVSGDGIQDQWKQKSSIQWWWRIKQEFSPALYKLVLQKLEKKPKKIDSVMIFERMDSLFWSSLTFYGNFNWSFCMTKRSISLKLLSIRTHQEVTERLFCILLFWAETWAYFKLNMRIFQQYISI